MKRNMSGQMKDQRIGQHDSYQGEHADYGNMEFKLAHTDPYDAALFVP